MNWKKLGTGYVVYKKRGVSNSSMRSRGRIAVILELFPKLSESFILDQITFLIDKGFEIDIYAKKDAGETRVHQAVHAYGLLQRTKYALPERKEKYDFILAHFGPSGVRALQAKREGLLAGRLVTFFHGADVTSRTLSGRPDYYRELFLAGQFFVTTSNFLKEWLISMGCPRERIFLYRLGVDTRTFQFSARTSLQRPVKILTIARLVEKKGIEYGMRAVHSLILSGIDVHYQIVGEGEESFFKNLSALICELGLESKVFLLGEKSREEVLDIIRGHDILLAPSITGSDGDMESSPVVIKEAMASGLAVVTTRHSGIPEIIEDGVSGYLVEEKDAEGLCCRVRELVEDDSKRVALIYAARRVVEDGWEQERALEHLVFLLEGWRRVRSEEFFGRKSFSEIGKAVVYRCEPRRLGFILEMRWLHFLGFCGQGLKKRLPLLYSKIKRFFPDRTPGDRFLRPKSKMSGPD